ncbi:MAG: metal-dependent hydrolase [Nitrososphaerales archaeon]
MEPVIHFAIPFAIATLLGLRLKYAFLVGLISLLPDFDVLFFIHRSVSHSLLIPLALLFISLLWKKSRLQLPLQLSSFGLSSHVILDFINGYTPILWPVSQNSFKLVFELRLLIESFPMLYFNLNILERPYEYGTFITFDAPLFTAEGLAIASLLIALSIVISSKGLGIFLKRDEV